MRDADGYPWMWCFECERHMIGVTNCEPGHHLEECWADHDCEAEARRESDEALREA